MDFVFRPHPLTFDYFVENNILTQREIDEFIADCDCQQNVNLDQGKEYLGTLKKASVMITDPSSVMVTYFATGKPIIFLWQEGVAYTEFLQEIIDVCYVAHNSLEVTEFLNRLNIGIDPLYKARRKLVSTLYGNASESVAKYIIEVLTHPFEDI